MVETTDGLVGYRTYPHVDRPETGQHAARAMRCCWSAGARGPRAAQAAFPDPAQRPVHAGRAVEGHRRALGRRRGRPRQPVLSRGLSALRPLLVRARPSSRTPGARRQPTAPPTRSPARSRCKEPSSPCRWCRPRRACARRWHRAHAPAARRDLRHPGQSGLRRHRRHDRRARGARRGSAPRAHARLPLRCRGRGGGAQGGRGRRDRHRARRPFRPRGRHASRRARTASPASARQDAHHRAGLGRARRRPRADGAAHDRRRRRRRHVSKRMQALDQAPFQHLGVEPKEQRSSPSRARAISAPSSSRSPRR